MIHFSCRTCQNLYDVDTPRCFTMKFILHALLYICCYAATAKADEMMIHFRVIQTKDILESKKAGKEVTDYSRLTSVAQGYFEQGSSVYLKTEEHQYRIKGELDGDSILSFTLSMYSKKQRGNVFSSSGKVKLSKEINTPSVKKGWEGEKYVVVWQRVNLKK